MKNKKRNILVSGGLGKLGLPIVRRIKLSGNTNVTILDNLKNSSLKVASEMERIGMGIFMEDIRRRKRICKDFDIVFHLAAHIDIDNANADPISDASNNILGTIALIKNYPSKKFVYFSSEDVYGKVKNASEEISPNPETPYGFSKLGGEVYVRMLCENYLILRIAENIDNVTDFIETVISLVERDINGTVNIGESSKISCQKLKGLMPFE